MIKDEIVIKNVKSISTLSIQFNYPDSKFIVITGRNGVGKTSLVKAFHLIEDPQVFQKTSGLNAIGKNSEISFKIAGFNPFSFSYNKNINALDTKDELPKPNNIIAELPIPFGKRFEQFSLISTHDSDIRFNIAATDYYNANELIEFLSRVYLNNKFSELKATKIKKYEFYILLREHDYYIREDRLSSGEYFLIQLYRLVTSGAKLLIIDELDIALDASAQVKLYAAIKPLLEKYGSRLIVISHSLAFMETVDDGGLYYLEDNVNSISLTQRSFSYIKSDLYGFKGYDRYILTEDDILSGLIEYLIISYSIKPYYQHTTIGLAGWNQLKNIVEKNDRDNIFSSPKNVIAIIDGDAYTPFIREYKGSTKIYCSPFDDIELYVYNNRSSLFPEVSSPTYRESPSPKKASKTYWKYLTVDLGINKNKIYEKIIVAEKANSEQLVGEIQHFLKMNNH